MQEEEREVDIHWFGVVYWKHALIQASFYKQPEKGIIQNGAWELEILSVWKQLNCFKSTHRTLQQPTNDSIYCLPELFNKTKIIQFPIGHHNAGWTV